MDHLHDLYQQVILDHNRKPRNFIKLESPSYKAEGFNPLCGDHLWVFLNVDEKNVIIEITFDGIACAICKSSASMMTVALKKKTLEEANILFENFQALLKGDKTQIKTLGSLKIFSNIWRYPSRIKCASLAWYAMQGAINQKKQVTTE